MMLKDKAINTDISKVKGEYIFLLDRSGSMSGDLIANALEALRFFIKSLPADCYVNIVSFGSRYEFMFKKSEKYGDRLIKKIEK